MKRGNLDGEKLDEGDSCKRRIYGRADVNERGRFGRMVQRQK